MPFTNRDTEGMTGEEGTQSSPQAPLEEGFRSFGGLGGFSFPFPSAALSPTIHPPFPYQSQSSPSFELSTPEETHLASQFPSLTLPPGCLFHIGGSKVTENELGTQILGFEFCFHQTVTCHVTLGNLSPLSELFCCYLKKITFVLTK